MRKLPEGKQNRYGYDAASRVTSITYTQGANTLGTLTYSYDANGRRTAMDGSLAQVNLPAAVASAVYNANNQLTNWKPNTYYAIELSARYAPMVFGIVPSAPWQSRLGKLLYQAARASQLLAIGMIGSHRYAPQLAAVEP